MRNGWEDEPPSPDEDPAGAPGYFVPFVPKSFHPVQCPWCKGSVIVRSDGLHYCDPCGKTFRLHFDTYVWRIPLHDGDSPDKERSKPDRAA